MDDNNFIRIKYADNLRDEIWDTYMRLQMIALGVTKTHCMTKTNGKSWLVAHDYSITKYLKIT
tara:strand:+ start:5406 stop:5594 length:189 start_codon:yes stop_codon:yes gene_type:complete